MGETVSGKLRGKTALVTGAASGLGYAIACRFMKEGAKVLCTDIEAPDVDLYRGIRDSDPVITAKLDVSELSDWSSMAELVDETFGQLDILVNNAGITLMGDIEEISLEAWKKTLDVDVTGPFLGCRAMLPFMKVNGGAIINIASVSSFKPQAELVAYNAAKAGVVMMTKSIALHCAKRGYKIRANTIHPGVIRTAMLEKVIAQVDEGEALMQSYKDMRPLGRIGEPEEIAAMATYLASDEASFITGSEFTVDGGFGIN